MSHVFPESWANCSICLSAFYKLHCFLTSTGDSLKDGFFYVCLNQGGKSRDKVVKISVSATPDEILEKLKREASS